MSEVVSWQDRAKYMTQTHKTIRALTRSLDAAQLGEHLDLEVDELLEQQHLAARAYDEAVDTARG